MFSNVAVRYIVFQSYMVNGFADNFTKFLSG